MQDDEDLVNIDRHLVLLKCLYDTSIHNPLVTGDLGTDIYGKF